MSNTEHAQRMMITEPRACVILRDGVPVEVMPGTDAEGALAAYMFRVQRTGGWVITGAGNGAPRCEWEMAPNKPRMMTVEVVPIRDQEAPR